MDFFEYVEKNADKVLAGKKQVLTLEAGGPYVICTGNKQFIVTKDEYNELYFEYRRSGAFAKSVEDEDNNRNK